MLWWSIKQKIPWSLFSRGAPSLCSSLAFQSNDSQVQGMTISCPMCGLSCWGLSLALNPVEHTLFFVILALLYFHDLGRSAPPGSTPTRLTFASANGPCHHWCRCRAGPLAFVRSLQLPSPEKGLPCTFFKWAHTTRPDSLLYLLTLIFFTTWDTIYVLFLFVCVFIRELIQWYCKVLSGRDFAYLILCSWPRIWIFLTHSRHSIIIC